MSALLCVQSHYGAPGRLMLEAEKRADALVLDQTQVTADHIAQARGLVTTMHLDQVGWMGFAPTLETFLDRGGRWFFNGHVLRSFLQGLELYRPIEKASREDLRLIPLVPHPVFAGIDRSALGARKGVAGFYGRGYNPLPPSAVVVTGVGPEQLPLDWDWPRPGGGRVFSHAGNDLPGASEDIGVVTRLARNILAWTMAEEEKP